MKVPGRPWEVSGDSWGLARGPWGPPGRSMGASWASLGGVKASLEVAVSAAIALWQIDALGESCVFVIYRAATTPINRHLSVMFFAQGVLWGVLGRFSRDPVRNKALAMAFAWFLVCIYIILYIYIRIYTHIDMYERTAGMFVLTDAKATVAE